MSLGSTFRARACATTSGANVFDAITYAVTPRFSSSTLSWKLHDEQEPQSPSASKAALYFCTTSSIVSADAGWLALGL